MSIPSIYINLDDDVSKIVIRLKHQSSSQVVLVCPKRCFLFSDSINLRLLKKQADLLGKEVFILTMDEKGQLYAKEAGFELKHLPKAGSSAAFSDIRRSGQPRVSAPQPAAFWGKQPNQPSQTARKIQSLSASTPAVKAGAKKTESAAVAAPEIASQDEPEVEVTETLFPTAALEEKIKKSHMGKIITGVVALSLILVLLLAFVILPKASVVVYPKTEPLTRDMEITISSSAKSIDAAALVMPAAPVSETVSVTDKFQSQGKNQIGNKASGTVKIFNFTKSPINLKASTTVLSVGGKTYQLTQDVMGIKPTVYADARTKEVNPASLGESVPVMAASGGDDYNLPQGTRLEISNQVFGSRPLLLYAKNDTEINGGTTRYLSVISADDLARAKTQLEAEALSQVRDKLGQNGGLLADGAFLNSAEQFTTDSPAGAQTPTFQGTLQETVAGLSFKREDLDNLIFARIGQTMDPNKTLRQSNPSQTTYKIKNIPDFTNGLAVFEVHFEGQAVFSVDLQNIAPELVGKSQSQVNEILRSKAAIGRVDITLAPSWQKLFPFFASKIQVSTATPLQ